jgi:hypothetical protein
MSQDADVEPAGPRPAATAADPPEPAVPAAAQSASASAEVSDPGAAAQPVPAAVRRPSRRHTYTVGDMVRSLGLILVIALAVLFLGPGRRMIFPGDQAHPLPHASYGQNVRAAAEVAHHRFLAPSGLPGGWTSTSARNSTDPQAPATLHVGFVTPKHKYAGLEESTGPAEAFLAKKLGTGAQDRRGSVDVGGQTWQRRTNSQGEKALTRTADGLTAVVTGSASRAELRTLAGSLRPVRPRR